MAITRANVEAFLVKRCGSLLTAAGMDGTTVSGSNADLNDPIGYAIRKCGGTVAALASVADSDLAGIDSADYDQLIDIAELRTLESIEGNLDDVDISVGSRRESLNQLAAQVAKKIDRKREQVERAYGVNVGVLEAGVVSLGFQEQNTSE
jgi:hypothetical protein